MEKNLKNYDVETLCVQAGYEPKNGEPRILPIVQSTTFKYDSTEDVADLFDLKSAGFFYSRIGNPTLDAVEKKISALEGGVGALLVSSGQSANLYAVLNIAKAGDNIVAFNNIYGGTFALFSASLKRLGVEVRFINHNDFDALEEKIDENTKAVFGETLANPTLGVLDIEKASKIAHSQKIPLIVDNTFATPILVRPFEYGADIVTHSTTKYIDGHATSVGGVIVDSGNFNWNDGNFPLITNEDPSYHGLSYSKAFGKAAYITRARVVLLRDFGNTFSPFNAFLTNLGLETLHLRIKKHSENAIEVAKFLENHEKIEYVNYPLLKSNKDYPLARKYLEKGASGVLSFGVKGGRDEAAKFIDKLSLATLVVHVSDVRTHALHPASSTHRQLSDEDLKNTGVLPNLIRLSVGIENVEDIIKDIENALR